MWCPVVFSLALLACIAMSLAEDEFTRPKRHLHHLRAIFNKGIPPDTVIYPPPHEERFNYIPTTGFKSVPTTSFLPEKIFVNPEPIIRTPSQPIHGLVPTPVFRHGLPCPPLPMVRLPPPPRFLIPYEPAQLVIPPPEIVIPPRFAPIPPPAPVFAPLPPRVVPVPHRSAPIPVPPPSRKIVPILPPEPLTPIIIPSFKYIYDQENQDGSITTAYSKNGKDVLVITTDKLKKIPPPVLVERVEKVVTGLPFVPAIPRPFGMGPISQVPMPLPRGQFSIHHRTPARPFFPLPPPAVPKSLVPMPPAIELKTKPAVGNPLSIPPPPPHIIDRLENIARIPNSGYSFKLSNEEGYLQQGDEKIYYSRLLPNRFSPAPLAPNPDRKHKPHQYTVIKKDKTIFDGIEEGSMRRHHDVNDSPHYGGPHLPNWVGKGYSYKLVEREPDFQRFGSRDDAVTVTRKIVEEPRPMKITAGPLQKNIAGFGPNYPMNLDNTGHYVQRYPFLKSTDPFDQSLLLSSDVAANRHEHIRPDGTKYICYEIHQQHEQLHPVLPLEAIRENRIREFYRPLVKVQEKTLFSDKIEKNIDSKKVMIDSRSSFAQENPSTEAPTVMSTTKMTMSTQNFSLNPIVVLPNENNYSYKVNNADGSSLDITSRNNNKVSVKVNDGKNRRRGDIPEAL